MRAKQISWADKLPEVKILAKTKTKRELATHFGVSIHSISDLLARHCIKAKPVPKSKIQKTSVEKLKEMRETMKIAEMAKALGATQETMRNHLKKHGLMRKTTVEEKVGMYGADIEKLIHTTSRNQICIQLQISHQTLMIVLNKMGLQDVFCTQKKVAPKKPAPQSVPATAKIVYPDGFKITRYVSAPCCDIRSPMKRENYDPKMHAASFGYSRL